MKESEIGEVYYKRLSEYLNKLKEKFVYCNEISMLDIENGEIMMSTTESNIGLIDEDYPYCLDVLGRNDLPFKDIHYSKYTKQIGMTLFGTLKKTDPVTMEETDVVNGIVIIRINTNNAIGSFLPNTS